MGTHVLRGMTAALLVTMLTLIGGLIWNAMGLSGVKFSWMIDLGLFVSCLVGGYRTARESGQWFLGGVAGAGYVAVGTLLLALFLPIRVWGFIQVLAEGAVIGLVAGGFAVGSKGKVSYTRSGRRKFQHYKPQNRGYSVENESNSNLENDNKYEWNRESGVREEIKDKSDWSVSWEPEFSSRELEPYKAEEWEKTKDDLIKTSKESLNNWGEKDIAVGNRPWWE